MSFTPYNAPLLAGLFGDHEIAAFFSVKAELDAVIEFETALAAAQAQSGIIPEDAASAIEAGLSDLEIDLPAITQATARDGVIVPELVRQMREQIGDPHAGKLHFGTTSQDVVDSSAMLRLRDCIAALTGRLAGLCKALETLRSQHGEMPIMSRTRMQQALPIKLADKIDNWAGPLEAQLDECPKRFPLQLGGLTDAWTRWERRHKWSPLNFHKPWISLVLHGTGKQIANQWLMSPTGFRCSPARWERWGRTSP